MACTLARLKHTVHVICSTDKDSQSIRNQKVWVHRVKKWRIEPSELSRLIYSYFVARKISNIDCIFDIVHASEFANEAFWFSLKKKCPLVTRLATPFFLVKKLNKNAFFGPRPLLNFMEKRQTLNSDGIFSSTYALGKQVSREWGIDSSKIEVIPNSIDLPRVRQLAQNGPIPDDLKGKEYIVYFGRLEERKGVNVLAQVLPRVLRQFPSLYMVFVGADLGYRRDSMRQYILRTVAEHEKRVIFYDNEPHERLFPIVKSARMAVLPSMWEAFGFVVVEAMALGCPVIATSGSGFEEIIEDNVSGCLVEPGNRRALERRMVDVLEDKSALQRLSEGAIERASYFEVSRIAHRVLAYYQKVIKRAKLIDAKLIA